MFGPQRFKGFGRHWCFENAKISMFSVRAWVVWKHCCLWSWLLDWDLRLGFASRLSENVKY